MASTQPQSGRHLADAAVPSIAAAAAAFARRRFIRASPRGRALFA